VASWHELTPQELARIAEALPAEQLFNEATLPNDLPALPCLITPQASKQKPISQGNCPLRADATPHIKSAGRLSVCTHYKYFS